MSKGMNFKVVSIDDVYGDTANVGIIDGCDQDVDGYNSDTFVILSTGDMVMTPGQARKMAAALILAADEVSKP